MKNLLFPKVFKIVGWLLFVPAILVAVLLYFGVLPISGIIETIVDDAAIIGVALGSLFIVCSKNECEDEMTRSIRLSALLSSVYVYVLLLVVGTLLINGIAYLMFALANLVLFPIIYVVAFGIEMHRYSKISEDEE